MTERIKKAREILRLADDGLYANQNRLRSKESELIKAKRLGAKGMEMVAILEADIAALKEIINGGKSEVNTLKAGLSELVNELVLPLSQRETAPKLDDRLPCLLFPMRMETRFMGSGGQRELWVRVYPDDIAVHIDEKVFTRDEAEAAIDYWIERTRAASLGNPGEKEQVEKGAWRALANSYGGTRASWLASEIKRRAIEKEGSEDFSFLLLRLQVSNILRDSQMSAADKRNAITALMGSSHPLIDLIRQRIFDLLAGDQLLSDLIRQAIIQTINHGILVHLGFNLEELKPESWSRAPRTEVMPDRFFLVGFANGDRFEKPFPNAVPSPLILGPNPQNLESELSQQDGELVVSGDFDWIGNFEAAIRVGMAMRVTLPEPFASGGFDRLMVLGLRISSEPAEHKELLEELIDSHRYAPEGMSFVPQGTPTNHTGELRSGFSTLDAEGEASFETETQQPIIESTDNELEKTDAQRLAEAWDLDIKKVAPLANGKGRDVSQAKLMNRALWPATLGYYFDEMLQLQPSEIGKIRTFFTENVVARGSLPAIRVGKQPYGILITSTFRRWRVEEAVDGKDFRFLKDLHALLKKVEDHWQQLVGNVKHVDSPGDSFANLLNILGLNATSVDFARRLGTHQTVLWNLAHFWLDREIPANASAANYFREVIARGLNLIEEFGMDSSLFPKLFGLWFSAGTSGLDGPLIDDVEIAEDEKLSETAELPRKYAIQAGEGEVPEERNYVGWLVNTSTNTLKEQKLVNKTGEALPIPKPLLYRMLHRSLLLSTFEATMNLYQELALVSADVRREQDFTNVEVDRTVTRWEFMEAPVGRIMPQVSNENIPIADFLTTANPATVPAAFTLQEVRESIGGLEMLTTAQLERLFVEHIDLCSYRLDAWQTAVFAKRLERLNLLRSGSDEEEAKRGINFGAYGYLENVRPGPLPVAVSPSEIPPSLQEEGVTVVEQPNNGGYIHGPSINHAVAAAVLRNGYLTHADQNNADQFSVRLSSERVRSAFSFLEGVRNGQELGALLGYQFERGLHDLYVIDGESLEQHILAFRKKYPMVADKITPGAPNSPIDLKESYHVVDGYALLEAVLFGDPPSTYPFGVQGLPDTDSGGIRQAIIAEVERLKDTLDSIADLSLAEGVFQVTQGNYERAGAMVKSLSEGFAPPEPEIVRTPRSGSVVNHKVMVHFEPGANPTHWGSDPTPRSSAVPGLNKWLGDLIGGDEDSLQFSIRYDLDNTYTPVSLSELKLQPIDLVYLIGDQAGAVGEVQPVNDLTELEARIDFAFRLKRKTTDPQWDSSGRAIISFMSRKGFPDPETSFRTLFELLPLLRNLRRLVTSCRPLGSDDYMLPSEENTDPNTVQNPKGWELQTLEQSFDQAAVSLTLVLEELNGIVSALPPKALSKDPAEAGDLSGIDYQNLRRLLVALSYFGLAGAFPKNALLPELPQDATPEQQLALMRARQSLIEQAVLTLAEGLKRRSQAEELRTLGHLTLEEANRLTVAEKAEIYQRAGALILGDAFRFVPTFSFKNRFELDAAHEFSNEVGSDESLLRFTQSRLKSLASTSEVEDWRELAVEEWLQGVAAVREKIGLIDAVNTYQVAFENQGLVFKPLQLPFDKKAHWVALEFPEVRPEQLDDTDSFVPQGDFLSIARQLPSDYRSSSPQLGLLIDEWNEVIPNRIETTGIALHYNQPNTEPPQCLLLAVSPQVNGHWDWEDLVETVTDTFDRAKRRAVEPDFLRTTRYAQLLPAVLSSFTSYPFGTISTNFASQATTMVVD